MAAIAELEDKKATLQNDLKAIAATAKDGEAWDDATMEKVANLKKEFVAVNDELKVARESLNNQANALKDIQSMIGDVSSPSASGNDGASSSDGGEITSAMLATMAKKFGTDDIGEAMKAHKKGKISFRAGSSGGKPRYAPFEDKRFTVGTGQESRPVDIAPVNTASYRREWEESIRNGETVDQFSNRIHRHWDAIKNECADGSCGDTMGPNDYASGGFLLNPLTFWSELQRGCDVSVLMRQLCRVETVSSIGVSIPRLTSRPSSFAWGCECEPPAKTASPKGDRIEIRPDQFTQCTGVCNALMKFTSSNPEALLLSELDYDLSQNLETAYLYGDGMKGPLGLLHAKAFDKPGNVDIELSAAAGLDLDFLIDLVCGKPTCGMTSFLFGKSAFCQMMKLKDDNSNPYWREIFDFGVGEGSFRGRFFGEDLYVSEHITADFESTSGYPVVLGDFSSYLILDGPATDTKRDTNIFTDRTCWVVRGYSGGGVINETRFRRVKMKA